MKTNFIRLVITVFCTHFLLSCNGENKDYDLADFFVEVSEKNGIIDLKIKSDIHKGENIIRAVYTDDKKSGLIPIGANKILPGESFTIKGNFEETQLYKFEAYDSGKHNLEFIFFNVNNYSRKYFITINVHKGFEFITKSIPDIAIVNETINFDYDILTEDSSSQSPYKLEFYIEDFRQEATLNGYDKGIWFDIEEISGTLHYTPKTPGIHNVTIRILNKYGIEKNATFWIEAK